MPYLKDKATRTYLRNTPLNEMDIDNKGELEFVIFTAMRRYKYLHPTDFANLHDCTYAAQHCADEFRRRFLDRREDVARRVNGDVTP